MNQPRTVRRRQLTALIWVSLEVLPKPAARGAVRGNTTRATDGSVWVAVYAVCSAPCPWSLDQGSRLVVSSFVVGFARNWDSSLYLGNECSPLELGIGPLRRFLINNFLPLSEFRPRNQVHVVLLASASESTRLLLNGLSSERSSSKNAARIFFFESFCSTRIKKNRATNDINYTN